jgi:hypothetical protein
MDVHHVGEKTLHFDSIVRRGLWIGRSVKIMDIPKKNKVYLKVE